MAEASRTAVGVLLQRAWPAEPGEPADEAAIRLVAGYVLAKAGDRQGLRAQVRLRSRFAEDELRRAVERGVRQLVVVGAGYDTFAYRQPAWARALTIWEVDHAESQAAKREALRLGSVAVPPNVRFVADDLEQSRLGDALAGAGFDASAPAFFACLGVLVYLTRAAQEALFAFVGGRPAGSALALSFVEPGVAAEHLAKVEALGEPFRTFDTGDELARALAGAGFRSVEVPTPDELARRFGEHLRPRRPFVAVGTR